MTWGISGTQFLGIYAAALVLAIFGTFALRRRLLHRSSSAMLTGALGIDELAFLSGGPRGLAASALVGLREREEVTAPTPRQVAVTQRTLPADATPAQRALHSEIARVGPYVARRVGLLLAHHPVVGAVSSALAREGLITDVRLRTRLRLAALTFAVLLAVGILRVVAGVHNHRPVVYLILLLLVTVGCGLLALRAPRVTPAGQAVLRNSRTNMAPLRTASLPGDRALAVALFGFGALWLAEPAMADELGFARAQAAATSSGAYWGGSSCGSDSSCGSGSSCGGSSCGGGGCGG